MLLLLKNGNVFSPAPLGKKDILLMENKILKIDTNISVPKNFLETDIVDLEGLNVIPGLIDSHIHLAGGGGEGGFSNRTPEVFLSSLASAGITTAIGLLGTDGTTRSVASLLAKARALESEGITTYILTGAYQVPTRTITQNPRSDIVLINKIIGIGEIAIADHRSSHPSDHELARLASEARVGGLLSEKAGILVVHLGDGQDGMDNLFNLLKNTNLPITQFLPTHVNRNKKLIDQTIKFARMGGVVDVTSNITPTKYDPTPYKPSKFIKKLIDSKVAVNNITMSSDSNGSSPVFDEHGNFSHLDIGRPKSLWKELRDMVLEEKITLSSAVKTVTSNVAKLLLLDNKGRIKVNKDADIVVFDKNFNIIHVIAKGRFLIKNKKITVKSTFENAVKNMI